MIGLESLRWALTVVFAAASVFHLVRCVRPAARPGRSAGHRISEACHLVMGVSMVAMIWPSGARVPAAVWAVVFTASTMWFLARTLRSPGRRLAPAYFTTSMATMTWMGVRMPATAAPGHAAASMAGMSMGATPAGTAAWISGVLGCYLVLAAFWWFSRGLRLGDLAPAGAVPRPPSWPAICHGVMSIGMGLTLLAMV